MKRLRALVALFTTAATVALWTSPARAQTSGYQRFDGAIVASGASGTREVVGSVIVGRGVFDGVGQIVEIENLPSDPDNASRDDLVFAEGVLHVLTLSDRVSVDVNPKTCIVRATLRQTTSVEGGTGQFDGASGQFRSTIDGRALAGRQPDGSCNDETQPTLFEVDNIVARGSLTLLTHST